MSTFIKKTKHPKTGEWENATWVDDAFGRHNYGIHFPSDNKTYDERDYEWETLDKHSQQ